MNEMINTTGQDIVPMDLMQRAITSGADVGMMEKLMELHERWQANKAHRSYAAAMADAKAEFPAIKKDRVVDYTNRSGQRTFYKFADMSTIAEAIDKPLSKHGLTYRFRTVTTAPAVVTVTCVVSHRDGYSEENSLSATADISGNKNAIQAIGSAVTYLQRYTLNAALGLTASDDDDANSAAEPPAERQPPRGNRPPPDDNDTPSYVAYVQKWEERIQNAVSAPDFISAWNSERPLRGLIEWPDGFVPAKLKDKVTHRYEELKKAGAQAQDANA